MSRSARQSRSNVLKEVVKQTESDLEEAFKLRFSQVQAEFHLPEVLNLHKELNSRVAACEKKRQILAILKYSTELNASEVQEHTHKAAAMRMSGELETVSTRIIQEEQTTETLKAMLEKVTTGQSIMKQRAREVQQVLARVSAQLAQARHMKVLAEGFCGKATAETGSVRGELQRDRERFQERVDRKLKDKEGLERTSRRKIERIGLAAMNQEEITQRKLSLVSSLEEETRRHMLEMQKSRQAKQDIAQYSHGFRVIAEMLAKRNAVISYESGLSPESVDIILQEYSAQVVQEASLASRYQQLTWDLREGKFHLKSLLRLLHFPGSTTSPNLVPALRSTEETADHYERLSISLHCGLLSLLTAIETVHERVSSYASEAESPDVMNWVLIRDLTKGFRLSHRQRTLTSQHAEARYRKQRRSFTHISPQIPNFREDEHSRETWGQVYGVLLTAGEIRGLAEERHLGEEETEQLGQFWRNTIVVSYFADLNMLRGAFQSSSQASLYAELIEKSNLALRYSVKDLFAYSKEALISFASGIEHVQAYISDFTQRHPLNSANTQNILAEIESNSTLKLKEIMRSRYHLLFRSASEEPNPSLHFNSSHDKRRFDSRKAHIVPPVDDEAGENQHIIASRALAKRSLVFPSPTLAKRAEIGRKLIHELEDPPETERAKSLLRGFLRTERKISAIKDSERVTFKQQFGHEPPCIRKFLGGVVQMQHSRASTAATKSYRSHHVRSESQKLFPTALQC